MLSSPTAGLDGVDEVRNHLEDAIGQLDELDARAVGDHFLVDVADAAVRDAALDDDRAVAQGEAELMEGVHVEREYGFDLGAAPADFLDGGRLEDHHLAVQFAQNGNPLCVAGLVVFHSKLDYTMLPDRSGWLE